MTYISLSFNDWRTHQVLECGFIVGHQVVHNGPPESEAPLVHLEEGGVQEKVQGFPSPRLTCVLVPAHWRQDLGTRPETRNVRKTGSKIDHRYSQSNVLPLFSVRIERKRVQFWWKYQVHTFIQWKNRIQFKKKSLFWSLRKVTPYDRHK